MSRKSSILGKRSRSELNHKSANESLYKPDIKKLKREHKQNYELEDGEVPSEHSSKIIANMFKENKTLKQEVKELKHTKKQYDRLNDDYKTLKNKFHDLIRTHQADLRELQKYREEDQLQLRYRMLCKQYPFRRWCRKLETCRAARCQFFHPTF